MRKGGLMGRRGVMAVQSQRCIAARRKGPLKKKKRYAAAAVASTQEREQHGPCVRLDAATALCRKADDGERESRPGLKNVLWETAQSFTGRAGGETLGAQRVSWTKRTPQRI